MSWSAMVYRCRKHLAYGGTHRCSEASSVGQQKVWITPGEMQLQSRSCGRRGWQ